MHAQWPAHERTACLDAKIQMATFRMHILYIYIHIYIYIYLYVVFVSTRARDLHGKAAGKDPGSNLLWWLSYSGLVVAHGL